MELVSLALTLNLPSCHFFSVHPPEGDPSQSQESVRTLQLQLEEQQAKRNGSEQLIGHLREELERLQSENAEEWGRRERLDAEKQVGLEVDSDGDD